MAVSANGPPGKKNPFLANATLPRFPCNTGTLRKRAVIVNCALQSIRAGLQSPQRNAPDHFAALLLFQQGKPADATSRQPIGAVITMLLVPITIPIVRQTREAMPIVHPSPTPRKLHLTIGRLRRTRAIPSSTRNTGNSRTGSTPNRD